MASWLGSDLRPYERSARPQRRDICGPRPRSGKTRTENTLRAGFLRSGAGYVEEPGRLIRATEVNGLSLSDPRP